MANNSTSFSLNTLSTPIVHVILNIISLIATALGTLLSFVILTSFLLRKQTFHDVSLLLCTNNYILIFFLGIFVFMDSFNTLQGDFGLSVLNENILLCRIQAYIVFSLLSAVYLACALQAVFRLCRIVYPNRIWLLNFRTYLIIISPMWVTSFALLSPLYIRYGHKLIPGEYICRITKDDAFSIAYSTITIYCIPFNCIAFTYFKVHQYIHRQTSSNNGNFQFRSRHRQRDIFIFRRIVIIVMLLGSYGMPNCIMLIMLAITGELVAIFYRILGLSFAAVVLTLSVAFFFITPQLREKIKCYQRKTLVTAIVVREYNIKTGRFTRDQLQTITRDL